MFAQTGKVTFTLYFSSAERDPLADPRNIGRRSIDYELETRTRIFTTTRQVLTFPSRSQVASQEWVTQEDDRRAPGLRETGFWSSVVLADLLTRYPWRSNRRPLHSTLRDVFNNQVPRPHPRIGPRNRTQRKAQRPTSLRRVKDIWHTGVHGCSVTRSRIHVVRSI